MMKHRVFTWLATLSLGTSVLLAGEIRKVSIPDTDLKEHISFLASDALEGREAGSRGGLAAGKYIVQRFKANELVPAGDGKSYFQGFEGRCRNILGLWEGSDPELAKQVVVLGAHYDHVGYGNKSNSFGPIGRIHNGADDNASGTSAVLELVDAITALPQRPKRSLLFVLWDKEEAGLNGSEHWVNNPTIDLDRVKINVNLDMLGRMKDRTLEVYGARTAVGLRNLISLQNDPTDLVLDFTWDPTDNSDHASFWGKDIPAIMFHTGLHQDYHRPSDDVEKINFKGLKAVTELTYRVVLDLADRPTLPGYRAAAESENSLKQLAREGRQLPQLPPRFGIGWQENDNQPGLLIAEVTADSAAAKAGIQAGDRLLRFGGEVVQDTERLKRLVWAAPAEVQVTLLPVGATEPVSKTLELPGKPIRLGFSCYEDGAELGTVVVSRIIHGTPAEQAGLEVQDRIYRLNGKPFARMEDLTAQFKSLSGRTTFDIERDGRLKTVELDIIPREVFEPAE